MPMTVATWNCAHGRGTGPDPRRLFARARRQTLADIGATLAQHDVTVAALQELDGSSWWSGRFDHAHAVATHGDFAHGVHGHHVQWAGLRYGTALLAREPLSEPHVGRFGSSAPTPRKGFVTARLVLDGRALDVVSVHLDFARAGVRKAQLEDLASHLATRRAPVVVMGDFNDEPTGPAVTAFRAQAGLHADDDGAVTFPKLGKRLDAILVSSELQLTEQQVLSLDLSDHRPVLARIAWA